MIAGTDMNSSTRWLGLFFLFFGLCMVADANAQQPTKQELRQKLGENPTKESLKQVKRQLEGKAQLQAPNQPSTSYLEVNNSTVVFERNGDFAFTDPFTGGTNGSFPRATSGSATFDQGLMYGGKVKDGADPVVRVGGGTYFNRMAPGGLKPDGTPENPSDASEFHVWRVDRNWTTKSVQRRSASYRAGLSNPADASAGQVAQARDQYEYDWNNWPADRGAPYQECNGEPGFQTSTATAEAVAQGASCRTESGGPNLEGDIPGVPGAAQTLWTVANDIGFPGTSGQDAVEFEYGSPAIGLEVQYTLWAYARPPGDPLGNINFINSKIIYTGKPDSHPNPTPDDAEIDSFFTSWWVDPDVGSNGNDYAGSNPERDLVYSYNSSPQDVAYEQIGLPPPAVGFDMLKGAVVDPTTREPLPSGVPGDTLKSSALNYFAAGAEFTDPALFSYDGTLQWFNLMRGVRPQPGYPSEVPFRDPQGNTADFLLTGDPVTGTGWIDGQLLPASDRRIVNTSGPVNNFEVGDTLDVTVAQVKALGTGFLSSIARMRFFDDAAQFAFNQDFELPSPPSTPEVTATGLDERVVLEWGTSRSTVKQIEEEYSSPPGFEFQGYRVYQLPSQTASLGAGQRIATFDENDGLRRLVDNVFDEETGSVVEKPVQLLNDTGIQRHLAINRDALGNQPLANGNDYNFAITAFGYLDQPGTEVPSRVLESQPARIQVRPSNPKPGTRNLAEVGQEIPVQLTGGDTTAAKPRVEVLDPTKVEDGSYTISLSSGSNPAGAVWNLSKGGNQLISGQGFGNQRVVDGLVVNVKPSVEIVGGVQDTVTVSNPGNYAVGFSTTAAETGNKQAAKESVDEIGVFPNPYRGFNKLEDSRFSKFVRFTNLPDPAEFGPTTIRIFTLSGTPVKIIDHTQESPNPNFRDWDLRNQSGTFVSSGIYLAHVNTPNGDKVLRLAMVMEEEILQRY